MGILFVVLTGIVLSLLFLVNQFCFSTSHLPKEELLVATVSYAVRGKVIWIDDHTVSINGMELDVRNDVYDWRKEK